MHPITSKHLLVACVFSLVGSLLARTHSALILFQATKPFHVGSRPGAYKYALSDVLRELPGDYGEAALEFRGDDFVIYPLNDSSAWNSLYPGDVGLVRLGPKGRPFGVSMYHQLHCLSFIRIAYIRGLSRSPGDPISDNVVDHYNHCFQFVRQSVLCYSDMTPIPTNGVNALHRCRDWTKVREFVENNIKEWEGIGLDADSLGEK